VLLAETVGDKELLRELSYRSARLREQLGHSEEALELFRRSAELTEQLCMASPIRARRARSGARTSAIARAAR
jgi:hypothetical protein